MQISLSIAIPVYNCADSIGENLKGILDQLQDRNDVEIIVSDNASTDKSLEIINQYASADSRIRVLSSARNVGMDGNVFKAVREAKGEFVHIMSADDFYLDGAIHRILELLHTHPELNVIILSNSYLNTFSNRIMNNKGYAKDIYCSTGGELLEKEELKSLCLSNIIVRKSNVEKIKNWKMGLGILWPHLFILSEVLKCETKSYIFSYKNPLIVVQFGNQRWVNKDAICTYYRSIKLYEKMIKNCEGIGKNSIKKYLEQVISPTIQKSNRFLTNLEMSIKFFSLYKDNFGDNYLLNWLIFSWKLLFFRKRKYFASFGEK